LHRFLNAFSSPSHRFPITFPLLYYRFLIALSSLSYPFLIPFSPISYRLLITFSPSSCRFPIALPSLADHLLTAFLSLSNRFPIPFSPLSRRFPIASLRFLIACPSLSHRFPIAFSSLLVQNFIIMTIAITIRHPNPNHFSFHEVYTCGLARSLRNFRSSLFCSIFSQFLYSILLLLNITIAITISRLVGLLAAYRTGNYHLIGSYAFLGSASCLGGITRVTISVRSGNCLKIAFCFYNPSPQCPHITHFKSLGIRFPSVSRRLLF
jgi:hypothetical protein